MRAGNRKPPKKQRRSRSRTNGRVTFVEWYHSWWFIILMMIFMPIAGIVLLITSPHRTRAKVIFVIVFVAIYFVVPFIVNTAIQIITALLLGGASASVMLPIWLLI